MLLAPAAISHTMSERSRTAIVLAAGSGRRMQSELPKVLHPLAGRPLLLHVLHALAEAEVNDVVLVVGASESAVREAVSVGAPGELAIRYSKQGEPRGTADAVLAAQHAVEADEVLVVNGDLGLVTGAQLQTLIDAAPAALVLAGGRVADPAAAGRVLRSEEGALQAVVEAADADEATLAVDEINVGLYRFDAAWLWPALARIQPSVSGELYLTDAVADAVGLGVAAAALIDLPDGSLSVESRADLARAEQAVRRRVVDGWLDAGVSFIDPAATYVDADVRIGPNTTIEPGVHLRGKCTIGATNRIGPNAVIESTQTGEGCVLESCTVRESRLGERVEVGPYSTIRPGSVLDDDVHVGTHAEVKNARLGAGARMGHFSYVGDADVGAGANIGAGAITCNFDGERKHRTTIGAGAFIGSDSLLIAPVVIGDGATTGAGSVINKDVPAGSRAVGHPARVRQRGADGAR